MECTREELIFLNVAHKVDQNLKKLGRQKRILLAQRFDLLSNVASYNGMFLGMANTAWTAQVKQVEALLKEIERAYARGYNKTGDLSNAKFFAERKVLFQRLDVALSRFGHPVMSVETWGLAQKVLLTNGNKMVAMLKRFPILLNIIKLLPKCHKI